MMRVVMRKKTLAAKCQESIDAREPMVQQVEFVFISSRINWICLPDASRRDLFDRSPHRNSGDVQGIADQSPQFFIALLPFSPIRRARKFRAKDCQILGFLTATVVLRFRKPRDCNGSLGKI